MENLTVIGTSHISADSVNEVAEYIEKHKPDIVAIELDHKRLHALFEENRRGPGFSDLKRLGISGFLFAVIGGWIQKKLGAATGIVPGSEMKTAFIEAKRHGLKVALIDQDIEITLKRFSKELTAKEKFRMLGDVLEGLFFGKRQLKKMGVRFDIKKVPEKKVIKTLMEFMKKRYPSIYKVLVEERNHVMAANLARIIQQNPEGKILAVVGAGHEDELKNLTGELLTQTSASFSYTISSD